jgi:hypothetical protein
VLNSESLELDEGEEKSVTVGEIVVVGDGLLVDTGILKPSVSLVVFVFVFKLVGDEFSIKIIMPELSNKHNHFRINFLNS